jgi:hypothetical protein
LEALVDIVTVSEPKDPQRHGGRIDADLVMRTVAPARTLANRVAVEIKEFRDAIDGD